jgi:hypothetical protein
MRVRFLKNYESVFSKKFEVVAWFDPQQCTLKLRASQNRSRFMLEVYLTVNTT